MDEPLPEFSPMLLLGFGVAFVPPMLLRHAAEKFFRDIGRTYPSLAERLTEAEGKSFRLRLDDMPFEAQLVIRDGRLCGSVAEKHSSRTADVTLGGSSGAFLALLEGRSDGDALFFSRNLRVEGDTEALLVLRNALDNEQILLRELIFSHFGALSGFARKLSEPAERVARRLVRDISQICSAAIRPYVQQQARLSGRLQALEGRCAELERALAKKQVRELRNG